MFFFRIGDLAAKDAMVVDGSMTALPAGVSLYALTPHRDARGSVLEIYRETWELGCRPVQFNALTSAVGVLRGVHVHVRHVDHMVLLSGRMVVGLHDMRPASPTAGASCLFELDAHEPRAVVVPPGVAHGLYFVRPEGVCHQWRKMPPGELSIGPVADERLGRATERAEAS
jgi:dTDP-4-dehydrorhamnose 3,5-epimerase